MPAENRVSIIITPEDKTAVNQAIATIREKLLPYLIALTPSERKGLPKMSDKTIPFVNKALNYAVSNPEFMPPYLQLNELNKDVNAVNTLNVFHTQLEQVVTGLDDTMMLAGSEAYIAALSYYNSVKQAAKINVPNAKTIYEDLKERFPQKSIKPETLTPAAV
jgi:hypothetical protein